MGSFEFMMGSRFVIIFAIIRDDVCELQGLGHGILETVMKLIAPVPISTPKTLNIKPGLLGMVNV